MTYNLLIYLSSEPSYALQTCSHLFGENSVKVNNENLPYSYMDSRNETSFVWIWKYSPADLPFKVSWKSSLTRIDRFLILLTRCSQNWIRPYQDWLGFWFCWLFAPKIKSGLTRIDLVSDSADSLLLKLNPALPGLTRFLILLTLCS